MKGTKDGGLGMHAASSSSAEEREIAIFWDYENVPLPDWCTAAVAAKAIVDAVSPYGRIVDRRLYYDFSKTQRFAPRDSSGLDSSGFDLVNTPARNQKETLDKKLIADVLTFAWDSAVRNDTKKPCVVLLTGDGDYAYTLAKLRDRGVMTIVMVGRDWTVAAILLDTADVALTLERDVLAKHAQQPRSKHMTPDVTTPLHIDDTTNLLSYTAAAPSAPQRASPPTVQARNNYIDSDSLKKRTLLPNVTSSRGEESDIVTLVRITSELLPQSNHEGGWLRLGAVLARFQQALRHENPSFENDRIKEMAKEIRKGAEREGFIATGRRVEAGNTNNRHPAITSSNDPNLRLSSTMYIRLLAKGEALLQQHGLVVKKPQATQRIQSSSRDNPSSHQAPARGEKSANIFIRQIPSNDIQQLVQFLEAEYGITVIRALMETPTGGGSSNNPSKTRTCFSAHVELEDPSQATVIIQAANKMGGGKGLYYQRKYLGVLVDTRAAALDRNMASPKEYYERGSKSAQSRTNSLPVVAGPAITTPAMNHDNTDAGKNDMRFLCKSILEMDKEKWVAEDQVEVKFRAYLKSTLHYATKGAEEMRKDRYMQVRDASVEQGLTELGRRSLATEAQVPVALGPPTPGFSTETYLRLLPAGREVAMEETENNTDSSMGEEDPATVESTTNGKHKQDRASRRHIFLSNLPLETDADSLASFFDAQFADDKAITRVELKTNNFRGNPCLSAHLKTATEAQVTELLSISKGPGVIFRGRRLYVAPDRTTPDEFADIRRGPLNPSFSYSSADTSREPKSGEEGREEIDVDEIDTLADGDMS